MSIPDRIVLLTSRDQKQLPSGVSRRVDHLRDYYAKRGLMVVVVAIRPTRARNAIGHTLRLLSVTLRRGSIVHVAGFFQPNMVRLAGYLTRCGLDVVVDICDSWLLLAEVASEVEQRRTIEDGVQHTRNLPRRVAVSYITQRDSKADFPINGTRRTLIVPPSAPANLFALAALSPGMAQRLTVSGDFASTHLREGIRCLRECWPDVRRAKSDASIDVYGPNARLLADISGSRVHGFVDDIGDLYRGNTVVLVLNRATSGVPNKIVEAVAAQRPMIVHESFRTSLSVHPLVHWYHDARSLKEAILALLCDPLPVFDGPIVLTGEVDEP